jgi:hypothetical protein
MQNNANSVEEYIQSIESERKDSFVKLYETVKCAVDISLETGMLYAMPSFFVPHSLYPAGYHCNSKLPLPFISIAAQKNFLALYHMGMYAKPELLDWFTAEYLKQTSRKPDMGKSCIRFKKKDKIPFELIAELCAKISTTEWIKIYEEQFKYKVNK